jgi:hypothetical protein
MESYPYSGEETPEDLPSKKGPRVKITVEKVNPFMERIISQS